MDKYIIQLPKILELIRKAVIVSDQYEIYEVDISYSCSYLFEFRIYRKGDFSEILMWESITFSDGEFDSKVNELGRVLEHLIQNGVMPDIYNFYLNNATDNDQLG